MHPETNSSRKLFPALQKKAWEKAVLLGLARPVTVGKGSPRGAVAIGRETRPLLNCNLAWKDHQGAGIEIHDLLSVPNLRSPVNTCPWQNAIISQGSRGL